MKGSFGCRRMGGEAEMVVVWATGESRRITLRGWAHCNCGMRWMRMGECTYPLEMLLCGFQYKAPTISRERPEWREV